MTIALPVAAILLVQEERFERAVEILGLAFQHPASAIAWMEQWPLLSRLRVRLEAELGAETHAAAWERGQTSNLEAVVLGLFDHFQSDQAWQAVQKFNGALIEPLSKRELEVLRGISGGLSNAEIAEQLFVQVSTIKKHITHLYSKLGVESRTQALRRAKELNLL
jgi:ATP/maltotriose-dependent transcriptional regulator MalT